MGLYPIYFVTTVTWVLLNSVDSPSIDRGESFGSPREEGSVRKRAKRGVTLFAVALLLLGVEGCKWFALTVKIPDFDSRQVQGVWVWRKDSATGQWQRAGQIVFQPVMPAAAISAANTPLRAALPAAQPFHIDNWPRRATPSAMFGVSARDSALAVVWWSSFMIFATPAAAASTVYTT